MQMPSSSLPLRFHFLPSTGSLIPSTTLKRFLLTQSPQAKGSFSSSSSPSTSNQQQQHQNMDEHKLSHVLKYHNQTKHGFNHYARGPHGLDWANQPNPFRRYLSSPLLSLLHIEEPQPESQAPLYSSLFHSLPSPKPISKHTISQFLYDSLALSAWKTTGFSTWSLRVNPSSGNLHPTEAYIVAPPIESLSDSPFVAHYAPKEHSLELRAQIPSGFFPKFFPPNSFLVGFSSIFWREAWKYGERAFRYCNHDVGHAIAAVSMAAASLGWDVKLLDSLGCEELKSLMGLHVFKEFEIPSRAVKGKIPEIEFEHPDCVMLVFPSGVSSGFDLDYKELSSAMLGFSKLEWKGKPNSLSKEHVCWDVIYRTAEVVKKPLTLGDGLFVVDPFQRSGLCSSTTSEEACYKGFTVRQVVRKRRSAVDNGKGAESKSSELKTAVNHGGKGEAESKSSELKTAVKHGENGAAESKASPLQQRRASARIQAKQKAAEELLAQQKAEVVEEKEKLGEAAAATVSANKRSRTEESVAEGEVVSEQQKKKKQVACAKREVKKEEVKDEKRTVDSENAVGALCEKSCAVKVKETIRMFNKHYLHFVQEEEKRCGKAKAEAEQKAAKKAKSKKKGALPADSKNTAKRPDLKAISKMMENNEILYPEKRIGNIPGIEVGYQFYSRAEMVAVGFHSHWLNGIDYMGQSYSKSKMYSSYEFPVAVAIVISGMYEDDLDNAEDVVYTGQGGHNLTGDKRQIRDQKLERGNLALKNCVEQRVPVRVVRGHDSASSYTGKVYTYDGLYKVVNYWAEKGISGFTVYKFRLRRLEGQPTLTTNQVYFSHGRVPQSVAEIRGLVCEDITGGQEDTPIPATNLVDDPPVPPTGFTYCKSLKVAKNVRLPVNAPGCKCKGICVDPTTCECAQRNGSDFPYVSRDGGRLVEAKDVVFECGPKCGCGPGCVNRTSQRGLRYRLEVFRTAKKGWAVRSWDFIPSGAPVCEYTGILARAEDMDSVLENNYIFEIDCLQTIKGLGGRERRSQNVSFAANLLDKYDDQGCESVPEFCIDAGSTGNIARFINHCCEPNLFVQCVLSTHDNLKLARVMLFAADNIPPLQELTYDYGYALDSVLGSDGKVKKMACYCGAAGCRKRLF